MLGTAFGPPLLPHAVFHFILFDLSSPFLKFPGGTIQLLPFDQHQSDVHIAISLLVLLVVGLQCPPHQLNH